MERTSSKRKYRDEVEGGRMEAGKGKRRKEEGTAERRLRERSHMRKEE